MSGDEEVHTALPPVIYEYTIEDAKSLVSGYRELPEFDPSLGKKDPLNAQIIVDSKFWSKVESTRENIRKELKKPSLEYGKKVDADSQALSLIFLPMKEKFGNARKHIDQYEKEQEQKRIDTERERVEIIGENITALKLIPLHSIGKTSQELTEIYESIEIPSEDIFEERIDEAMLTYKDTMSKLETAIVVAIKIEQADAIQAEADTKRKEEEAILEEARNKEREEFEAEKAEFAEMKRKQERENQAQQEEINIQNAEREAEELAKQQEEELEEANRIAREANRIEQKKIEEKRIEDEKLFSEQLQEKSIATQNAIMSTYDDRGIGGVYDDIIAGLIPHVKWGFDNEC